MTEMRNEMQEVIKSLEHTQADMDDVKEEIKTMNKKQ